VKLFSRAKSASKAQPQSITSLGMTPDEERHARMIKYVTAMSIRMLCFISFFFIHGWWLLIPGIGAVVLPYIGVVTANTIVHKPQPQVEQPGGVVVLQSPGQQP